MGKCLTYIGTEGRRYKTVRSRVTYEEDREIWIPTDPGGRAGEPQTKRRPQQERLFCI